MKIVNFMNFARQYDPRFDNSEAPLLETTQKELAMAKEFDLEHTFLLQYDTLLDENYVNLFKTEADHRTELGLWYEIVKPLTDKAGLAWRGKEGWTWDWHIVPGFSMAYTNAERELLIDVAMEEFKTVFGYYPRTVASWMLDSHTVQYLAEKYHISAAAICRDQLAIDAYTLVGGYFNQAYYPSKNNIITPAQTKDQQINVPVFRLLGPDPIHCYDEKKFILDPETAAKSSCFTIEPAGKSGSNREIVQWYLKNYFTNEDLGFSYMQVGQENSFCQGCLSPLRMQLEELKKYPDVKFMKMGDTGEWFKEQFPDKTPATSISGLDDWATDNEVQSVYYDCCNYVANIFRCRDKIFLRALYLFDEMVRDAYLDQPCDTWDAIYENLPVVDTLVWKENEKNNEGLVLDEKGCAFDIAKAEEQVLAVKWSDKSVIFSEKEIGIRNIDSLYYDFTGCKAEVQLIGNQIRLQYKGTEYAIVFDGAELKEYENGYRIKRIDDEIRIKFGR